MKIDNIQIENFRNIIRADINLKKINIFTGKNSSGKSNLLLAISNSIKTDSDFSDIFYDNIVTFGPGKSKALFKTKVSTLNTTYIYSNKEKDKEPGYTYISPESFTFENSFSKKSLSPIHHKLFFSGELSQKTDLAQIMKDNDKKKNVVKNKLVYERSFNNEKIENIEDNHIIKNIELSNFQYSDKLIDIFSGLDNSLFSWIDSKTVSSTSIFKYVTERINNNEIYEQIIDFLKESEDQTKNQNARTPFVKAKFIHLLADVQKNKKQKKIFSNDLKLYTDGLLTNLTINLDGSIGNKGEIIVESCNSPKDIFCVSAGTAVLIYFILLKNWVELSYLERSFIKPDIMIFDEIDCIIHPSLMSQFTEILKSLSNTMQLFISTHSPHFIDCFDKNELFWLKDTTTINNKNKTIAISNVYSYKDILDKLPNDNAYFAKKENSELFVNGLIDSLFPLI
jgi:hypothetical protein